MKITVQSGTGTAPVTTVLGDDATGAFIVLTGMDRNSLVQEAARLRASAMANFDRGNTKASIVFTAERAHVSYEAAVKFLRDHFLDVPKQGLVAIIQSGGQSGFQLFLQSAIIQLHLVLLEGVTTRMQYTVQGGEFQPGGVIAPP